MDRSALEPNRPTLQPDLVFRTQQLLFFIEAAYMSQHYYNWKQADMARSRAIELSALEVNLTGRLPPLVCPPRHASLLGQLGKRTRYQINNTSQLLLDITRKDAQQATNDSNKPNGEPVILPKVTRRTSHHRSTLIVRSLSREELGLE